tara:strand:+ start:24119 stop:24577 length:459 start_codon:yes stop_codon:yes gene_type:complete
MGKIEKKLNFIKLFNKEVIKSNTGSVMKIIDIKDKNFQGFGETYFSTIKYNTIKGWKLHKKMHMNLVVPHGSIKFVFYDQRKESKDYNKFLDVTLNFRNYKIIYVPPKIWFAFKGLSKSTNILLNFANIRHNDKEVIHKQINEIKYPWRLKK